MLKNYVKMKSCMIYLLVLQKVKLGGETVATLGSNNGVENNVSVVSKTSGNKTLVLTSGEVSYSINVLVAQTSMNLHEISLGLAFDFNAIGKSNNSSDRDQWAFRDYVATLDGFNWNNNSGWVNVSPIRELAMVYLSSL